MSDRADEVDVDALQVSIVLAFAYVRALRSASRTRAIPSRQRSS